MGTLDSKQKKLKKYGKIYIGGSFDLFHPGHVELLRHAKSLADYVIVALNTDEFHKKYKGSVPILSLEERMIMVDACRYVDEVDINDGDEDSTKTILRHMPDAILHGDDWVGNSLMQQMNLTEEFLKQNNITMIYTPYFASISSTDIKNRIKNQ